VCLVASEAKHLEILVKDCECPLGRAERGSWSLWPSTRRNAEPNFELEPEFATFNIPVIKKNLFQSRLQCTPDGRINAGGKIIDI